MEATEGICCICGEARKLSFEHVPPKRAFNDRPVLNADINSLLAAQTYEEMINARRSRRAKGAGAHTLCEPCNNNTGSWYGPAYVAWTKQGAENVNLIQQGRAPRPYQIKPLSVIKMIVAMFASACGSSLFEGEQSLRRFILDRHSKELDPSIVPFGYYLAPDSTAFRQSGVSGLLSLDDDRHSVFSEIAFYPFGTS
jgi:hypothetical protein